MRIWVWAWPQALSAGRAALAIPTWRNAKPHVSRPRVLGTSQLAKWHQPSKGPPTSAVAAKAEEIEPVQHWRRCGSAGVLNLVGMGAEVGGGPHDSGDKLARGLVCCVADGMVDEGGGILFVENLWCQFFLASLLPNPTRKDR